MIQPNFIFYFIFVFPSSNKSSSPDSLNADRSDKSNAISPSPVALYKLVVPLLRCEVADVRDAAVNALGMINHDALKYDILLSLNLFDRNIFHFLQ